MCATGLADRATQIRLRYDLLLQLKQRADVGARYSFLMLLHVPKMLPFVELEAIVGHENVAVCSIFLQATAAAVLRCGGVHDHA